MGIKITAQQDDIEKLIKEIGRDSLELEGRGYTNPAAGISGFMIYVKGETNKMIDIFIQEDEDNIKKLPLKN